VKLPAHLSTLLTHLSTDCETTGTPVYPTDTPVHWLWNYRRVDSSRVVNERVVCRHQSLQHKRPVNWVLLESHGSTWRR